MRFPVRACALLVALLLVVSTVGLTGGARAVSSRAQPIEVADIQVPNEVAQATRGQVSANVTNSVNETLSGFARFTDNDSQITCTIFNFTIAYQQKLNVTVDYRVADDAKLGPLPVTFEISVGGFSFLLQQYVVEVIPVAAITSLLPGQVFSQGQAGILVATILNRADHTKTVRLDTFGPKFINTSEETELAPGTNMIAVLLQHNASHVYDFGMCPVNVSIYYQDKLIGSAVAVIPVDMTLLNKALGVIVPLLIFECLVLFYAYRKTRRTRAASQT